jgi:DTW domain-containing protein YfiP
MTDPDGHAVFRLRAERSERVRKPYVARGSNIVRCGRCRVAEASCLCALRPIVETRAGFCLLMHDLEPLRPSNTGWLVADVVADTHAFLWSRTRIDPVLLALLADPTREPYLVFPASTPKAASPSAPPDPSLMPSPNRTVRTVRTVPPNAARRPLFVILDGTWQEARKMFRKSPWLDRLPLLDLKSDEPSRYRLRRRADPTNLCTAEVATLCLHLADEPGAASALDAWFCAFIEVSMRHRRGCL